MGLEKKPSAINAHASRFALKSEINRCHLSVGGMFLSCDEEAFRCVAVAELKVEDLRFESRLFRFVHTRNKH